MNVKKDILCLGKRGVAEKNKGSPQVKEVYVKKIYTCMSVYPR